MNYFFDSSALIKLYHPEIGSQRVAAMFGGTENLLNPFDYIPPVVAATLTTVGSLSGRSR